MFDIGHVGLAIILGVSFAIQLGALFGIAVLVHRAKTRTDTVLGALIIQEADKIRQLVSRASS